MASAKLEEIVKEGGKGNLSPSALDKYETHQLAAGNAQAQLAAANALPAHTAALQTAKNNAIQAAQRQVQATSGPVLYDFPDINSTARKIADEGYKVVGEGPKEGFDAKIARQKSHELTDSLVDNVALLDPKLGQQFANDRVNLRRLNVFTDVMQHALSGDNAGIAK